MRPVAGSVRLPVAAAVATLAATVCLAPVFLRGTWFFPSVFAVLVVTAATELTRRYAVERAVVPLGGAAALLAYLLLRYAGDAAAYHVLPTPTTLDRLGALAESGRLDIARYAAPIGVSPGIELLTVAGVGLVALTVDTLAVTYRRAALAGLPLLTLYTVPTAVAPAGVGWVAFAVAATGFLALLLAESRERVSRWGRPMVHGTARTDWSPRVETAPLGQVGRRVGATALGLALVVPAALPNLNPGSLGFGTGGFGSGGGGDGRVAVVNPIVDLGQSLRRPENRPVLQYRGRPTYLRLVGLDQFTGALWKPSELKVSREDNNVADGLAGPPGLGATVTAAATRYRIKVFDLKQTWLPLPYPTTLVEDIDGTWLYDASTFNVFGENTSTQQLAYTLRALDVRPTAEQLRAAPSPPVSVRRYLRLPRDLDPQIEQTARTIAGSQPTAYDKALALQDWLRSEEFSYSTEVAQTIGDANGGAAIVGFLATRTGYCVHFASTMAVMARQLGIPARVAVGFTAGTPVSDGSGGRMVSLHDAHSWPELYFQGVGWVAFEPTPAVRTGEPPEWARAGAAGPDTPTPTSSAAPSPTATAAPENPRLRERQDTLELGAAGDQGGSGGDLPVLPLVVGLALLGLLSVPAGLRWGVRQRRWSGARGPEELSRAAWADLQDTLVDYGHQWNPADSPRTGVARVVRERSLPEEAVAAARALAEATERARYAPVMTEVGDLRREVDLVRSGLHETAGRWDRARARLLPRSTRTVATGLGERLADGLDALDEVVAGVGTRLRGRASRGVSGRSRRGGGPSAPRGGP